MTSKHHSLEVRNAIISLWAKGDSYSIIVKKINSAGISQISKGTVWFEMSVAGSIFKPHLYNFVKSYVFL